MRRRAIVAFVGMLASVMASAAPAFGAEDNETDVEAGSVVPLHGTGLDIMITTHIGSGTVSDFNAGVAVEGGTTNVELLFGADEGV